MSESADAPSPMDVLRRHVAAVVVAALVGGGAALVTALVWPTSYRAHAQISVGHVPADPLAGGEADSLPLADLSAVVAWLRSGSLAHDLSLPPPTEVAASAYERIVSFSVASGDEQAALSFAAAALARVESDHKTKLDAWSKAMAEARARIVSTSPEAGAPAGSRDQLLARIDIAASGAYAVPTRRVAEPWSESVRPPRARFGIVGALSAAVAAWLALFLVAQRRRGA